MEAHQLGRGDEKRPIFPLPMAFFFQCYACQKPKSYPLLIKVKGAPRALKSYKLTELVSEVLSIIRTNKDLYINELNKHYSSLLPVQYWCWQRFVGYCIIHEIRHDAWQDVREDVYTSDSCTLSAVSFSNLLIFSQPVRLVNSTALCQPPSAISVT